MSALHLSVNYEVHRKEKFQHFLNTYAEKIDKDLVELEISRYDKIPEQWQARFFLILPQTSNADRVYEQLLLANALSLGMTGYWQILGPYDDGELRFECIFNTRKKYQPLKWAHLST